nr:sigma-70 family RNA polymerase sigma factor [Pullulanibacillus pueri]
MERTFEELIRQEKNKLYRIAFLYLKDKNDALEIVQETLFKAFRGKETLKEPQYFSTWITKILINTALDFINQKNRVQLLETIEKSNDRESVSLEEKIDLVNAIQRLKEPYKSVIILRYYRDFTIKQIAETLHYPEGTVKSYLHRGMGELKVDLKEDIK